MIIWFEHCDFGHLLLLSSSLSYEEGHPSLSETNRLEKQTFATSHQLPGYPTTSQPTGKNSLVKYNMNLGNLVNKEKKSVFTCWVMNIYIGHNSVMGNFKIKIRLKALSFINKDYKCN